MTVVPPAAPAAAPRVGRILVVNDDRRMASGLAQWLCSQGWHATAAGSAAEAVRAPGRSGCDVCLIDGLLPDDGGRRVAAAIRAASPLVAVVALGGGPAEASPWADATVPLPVHDDAIAAAIDRARTAALARSRTPAAPTDSPTLLGRHPAIARVLDLAARVAGTPATVLVTGESGTGKSLLAREIHRASGRRGRFVEVACGSLAESLLESELFGHVAGAFTGATTDRAGKFLQADRGTIFLDEIATAPPALQVKLLRVLQEMQFEPVGGAETRTVDARVILATHDDLEARVADGSFRADLWWRINVVTIEMPPLRERASDVPLLAEHFLRAAAARAGRAVTGFSAAAAAALAAHAWPGNVRELRHAVERAVFLGRGDVVEPGDLPAAVLAGGMRPADRASELKRALAEPERQLIVAALERCGWRRDAAARALGINRTTLYKKAKRLGLDLAALEPAR